MIWLLINLMNAPWFDPLHITSTCRSKTTVTAYTQALFLQGCSFQMLAVLLKIVHVAVGRLPMHQARMDLFLVMHGKTMWLDSQFPGTDIATGSRV